MSTVVVTGAGGSVGRRVVPMLADAAGVDRVLGVDLDARRVPRHAGVEAHRLDLCADDLVPALTGVDTVVHLASMFRPTADGVDVAPGELLAARRLLEAAADAGVGRMVVLSSAMVYGAHADNPVPLTEDDELRPNPEFSFAVAKAGVEELAGVWRAGDPGRRLAILRPTTALAERDVTWVARGLRAAAVVDVGDLDPPQQYLHLDDLAAAVLVVAMNDADGVFNAAPDGWIDGEVCRELSGRLPRVRVPAEAAEELSRFRWRHRLAPTPPGLTPYTMYPWVVANDRLRELGWEPQHSNEESFVEGTPGTPWASMNARRRQQLAMGGAGAVLAGLGVGAGLLWRRLR